MNDTVVQLFWTGAVVFGFLGALLIPAAIVESRWGRRWIERTQKLEEGRIRQEADYLLKGMTGYRRDEE